MIIIRKYFSSKEEDEKTNKKSHKAEVASAAVGATGVGGTLLGKHIADSKANRRFDIENEGELKLRDKRISGIKEKEPELLEQEARKAERLQKEALDGAKAYREKAKYARSQGKFIDAIPYEKWAESAERDAMEVFNPEKFKEAVKNKSRREIAEAEEYYGLKLRELERTKNYALKRNKKIRNLALVGTGLAAAGTYGIAKHKENKKNKLNKK